MKTVTIQGRTGKSAIIVGEQLQNVAGYLPESRCLIITDANVRKLYGRFFPDAAVIEIGMGESIKTLETASFIYEQMIQAEADRATFLLGIGGGIVCDITGFIASTFMRGIRFGFVPSTLLAQVDASVGGKNGVNFLGYKNMVGVFNQPEFVLCDPDLLQTLPPREIGCGFAEIIKHAAISDAAQFDFLEANPEKALALETETMNSLVYASIRIKSDVVNRDETEQGERRKLNFGHTFGHAIEKKIGLPHGEAVAIGMRIAAELSVKQGLLTISAAKRLDEMIETYIHPPLLQEKPMDLLNAVTKDKKKFGDRIRFILLDRIGSAVEQALTIEELTNALNYINYR